MRMLRREATGPKGGRNRTRWKPAALWLALLLAPSGAGAADLYGGASDLPVLAKPFARQDLARALQRAKREGA